jgi:DNA-binding HxlR family transcriptional regulator
VGPREPRTILRGLCMYARHIGSRWKRLHLRQLRANDTRFKSLDYANMPQSKQNISQIEPVDVVF